MAWSTLAVDDVKTRLAWPELSALLSYHLAPGQSDPIGEVVSGVVNEVRGRVAACSRNTLGPANTVPDSLSHATLSIIRHRLATRLPGSEQVLDDVRQGEYRDAMELLKLVSKCDFYVEPGNPSTATSSTCGGSRYGGEANLAF